MFIYNSTDLTTTSESSLNVIVLLNIPLILCQFIGGYLQENIGHFFLFLNINCEVDQLSDPLLSQFWFENQNKSFAKEKLVKFSQIG